MGNHRRGRRPPLDSRVRISQHPNGLIVDRTQGIVLWVAGFAGVLLIYSAYKGQHPLEVINSGIAPIPSGAASPVGDSSVTTQTDSASPLTASGGFVYDANGNVVSDVPSIYAKNPASYVPSRTAQ